MPSSPSNANNNENMGWMGEVMLVPTKNPDNDDRAASPTSITSLRDTKSRKQYTRGGTQQRQGHDAFLYYSNDEVRINALKLRGDGSRDNHETHQQQQPLEVEVERKTKLSFELHPSLLLEDLFDGVDDDIFGEEDIDIEELILSMTRTRAV